MHDGLHATVHGRVVRDTPSYTYRGSAGRSRSAQEADCRPRRLRTSLRQYVLSQYLPLPALKPDTRLRAPAPCKLRLQVRK